MLARAFRATAGRGALALLLALAGGCSPSTQSSSDRPLPPDVVLFPPPQLPDLVLTHPDLDPQSPDASTLDAPVLDALPPEDDMLPQRDLAPGQEAGTDRAPLEDIPPLVEGDVTAPQDQGQADRPVTADRAPHDLSPDQAPSTSTGLAALLEDYPILATSLSQLDEEALGESIEYVLDVDNASGSAIERTVMAMVGQEGPNGRFQGPLPVLLLQLEEVLDLILIQGPNGDFVRADLFALLVLLELNAQSYPGDMVDVLRSLVVEYSGTQEVFLALAELLAYPEADLDEFSSMLARLTAPGGVGEALVPLVEDLLATEAMVEGEELTWLGVAMRVFGLASRTDVNGDDHNLGYDLLQLLDTLADRQADVTAPLVQSYANLYRFDGVAPLHTGIADLIERNPTVADSILISAGQLLTADEGAMIALVLEQGAGLLAQQELIEDLLPLIYSLIQDPEVTTNVVDALYGEFLFYPSEFAAIPYNVGTLIESRYNVMMPNGSTANVSGLRALFRLIASADRMREDHFWCEVVDWVIGEQTLAMWALSTIADADVGDSQDVVDELSLLLDIGDFFGCVSEEISYNFPVLRDMADAGLVDMLIPLLKVYKESGSLQDVVDIMVLLDGNAQAVASIEPILLALIDSGSLSVALDVVVAIADPLATIPDPSGGRVRVSTFIVEGITYLFVPQDDEGVELMNDRAHNPDRLIYPFLEPLSHLLSDSHARGQLALALRGVGSMLLEEGPDGQPLEALSPDGATIKVFITAMMRFMADQYEGGGSNLIDQVAALAQGPDVRILADFLLDMAQLDAEAGDPMYYAFLNLYDHWYRDMDDLLAALLLGGEEIDLGPALALLSDLLDSSRLPTTFPDPVTGEMRTGSYMVGLLTQVAAFLVIDQAYDDAIWAMIRRSFEPPCPACEPLIDQAAEVSFLYPAAGPVPDRYANYMAHLGEAAPLERALIEVRDVLADDGGQSLLHLLVDIFGQGQ